VQEDREVTIITTKAVKVEESALQELPDKARKWTSGQVLEMVSTGYKWGGKVRRQCEG